MTDLNKIYLKYESNLQLWHDEGVEILSVVRQSAQTNAICYQLLDSINEEKDVKMIFHNHNNISLFQCYSDLFLPPGTLKMVVHRKTNQ